MYEPVVIVVVVVVPSSSAPATCPFPISSWGAAVDDDVPAPPPPLGLKSLLHPTSNTGTPSPQYLLTSSIHFVTTFSSVSGVSIAKAIRMTWDLAYERGRSCSYSSWPLLGWGVEGLVDIVREEEGGGIGKRVASVGSGCRGGRGEERRERMNGLGNE